MDSTDAAVEPVPADATGGQAFRVRVQIAKEGPQASEVRFFVRKPGRELTPVGMKVSYDGDAKGVLSGDAKTRSGP